MPSSDNLLQVVNSVLLSVGETPVKFLTESNTAIKATDEVIAAFAEFQTLADWRCLYALVNAPVWSLEKADFSTSPFWRVVTVYTSFANSRSRYPARFTPDVEFNQIVPREFSGSDRVTRYCITGDNVISVDPYPTTDTQKLTVLFSLVKKLTVPRYDTAFFPVSDNYIELIKRLAEHRFISNHLGDVGLSQLTLNNFQSLLRTMRARESSTPVEGLNMFRRL